MPAVPGTHLVLIHAHLAFASFEAGFNASARLDHPCQFPQRRLRERSRTPSGRREVVMVAVALILIGGIPRGTGLPGPVVRQGPTGDHQPLCGSRPFALEPRLHPAFDHLDGHRAFLPVSHRQPPPGSRVERLAPLPHRLPRGFRAPSTPLVRRQWRLQVAHRGGARYSEHIALTALAQVVAQPRVAPQLIVTRHPAVRHLFTPLVEHLQALLVSRLITDFWWHVAFLASLLVSGPLLG